MLLKLYDVPVITKFVSKSVGLFVVRSIFD